ncbi:MAG TPA: hypothetical protein VMA35_05335 [Candidatus Sulfopaludibacter sp.]|nr:hypothetical protein [Candidatus Sulfopaludibacter sp.]
MRRLLLLSLLLGSSLSTAFAGDVVTGRVVKVLPFFLDLKGQRALTPSLYDRDAYQTYLRRHANQRSAIRFDVLWKASEVGSPQLKLRVELRGIGKDGLPRQATLEQTVTPHFFRHWNSLTLDGAAYKDFGELVAWRVTLWSGAQQLSEQRSFLW